MVMNGPLPRSPSVSASSRFTVRWRWPTLQQLEIAGFMALIVLAVVFYLWWGLSFGVWIDNGVYAVVITLLLFGVAGLWLVWPSPAPSPPGPPRS
jgi:hypothetical protein